MALRAAIANVQPDCATIRTAELARQPRRASAEESPGSTEQSAR